jgi:uncharacterized protein (UPF0212 family)
MPQRDYVVVIKVLGRVMHKIIVRAVSESVAEHIALFIAKDLNELTQEELNHVAFEVASFNDLDLNEYYVCF